MKIVRTVKVKLDMPAESILPTISSYTKAFNHVCRIGWDDGDCNGISLHHKTYYDTREYLPSQLAISARMRAAEALKGVRAIKKKGRKATCPQSKQSSIRLDARSYNLWIDRREVSIMTIDGRLKTSIKIPEYFHQYLEWKRASADLFVKKGQVFMHIIFTKDITDARPNSNTVGIDRGIRKIAVTSENEFFSGGTIRNISLRYERLRASLQSCGSDSAKRHLQKVSKKENRFRRDVNHVVTKQIIDSLEEGDTIVLEKLTGILQGKRLRKKQRSEIHKWNFYQFEQFITYKAEAKGITVEYVDARYTSQKCSVCGYVSRSNRQSQSIFCCKQCSFSLNADLNASRNIRQNFLDAKCHPERAAVNQPIAADSGPAASHPL